MKTIYYFLLFLIVISGNVQGQDKSFGKNILKEEKSDSNVTQSEFTGIGVGFIFAGITNNNYNSLNERLSQSGCPTLNNNVYSAGFEFLLGKKSDFSFISNTLNYYGQNKKEGSFEVNMLITNFISEANFNVIRTNRVFIHPHFGLGFSTRSLKINYGKNPTSFNNNINLKNTTAFSNLSTEMNTGIFNFLFDFGLGLDFLLFKSKNIFLGVKGAYNLPLTTERWESNGIRLANAPTISTKGFYAGISISSFLNLKSLNNKKVIEIK